VRPARTKRATDDGPAVDYERQEREISTSDTEVSRNSLEIVRSFITTWNDHDINVTMELLDPDIAFQSPLFSDPVRGIRARTEVNENFMTSMPDFQYQLIRITSDGDYVAAELVGTGTSTGPTRLPGRDPIPPTGRHVEFPMAGFFRVTAGGKIAEERYCYYRLVLLQQLNPGTQP
jgi:predicted ester cyclase